MSTIRVDNFGPSAGGTTYSARGIAKAWVNFDGTGTIAIRVSENTSSLADNGTGQYAINLTNAMSSSANCFVSCGRDVNNGMGVPTVEADPTRALTASYLPLIYNYQGSATFFDAETVCVAMLGDLA